MSRFKRPVCTRIFRWRSCVTRPARWSCSRRMTPGSRLMNATLEVAAVFREVSPVPGSIRADALTWSAARAARRPPLPHGGPGRPRPDAATTAATSRFHTTRAATGTAPSARPRPGPPGSTSAKANCCPYRTSTSCSRCPTTWRPLALQNQRSRLRHPVPGRRRDAAEGRRRSQASRRPRSAA